MYIPHETYLACDFLRTQAMKKNEVLQKKIAELESIIKDLQLQLLKDKKEA